MQARTSTRRGRERRAPTTKACKSKPRRAARKPPVVDVLRRRMRVGFVGYDSTGGFRAARRGLDLHALVVGARRSRPLIVDVRACIYCVHSHRAFGGACEGFSCLNPYFQSNTLTSPTVLATHRCAHFRMSRYHFLPGRLVWSWVPPEAEKQPCCPFLDASSCRTMVPCL